VVAAACFTILDRSLSAGDGGGAAKTVSVPLGEVYTTSEQKGLKRVARGEDRTPVKLRSRLTVAAPKGGLPDAFLARGRDITAVVGVTASFYEGGGFGDGDIGPEERSPQDQVWLVAYLGRTTSDPLRFEVTAVERRGAAVRLSYRVVPLGGGVAVTLDRRPYYYWAPLGRLAPGAYQVELYDAAEKQVTLMRRVVVPGK
jgi:hypothetical protein